MTTNSIARLSIHPSARRLAWLHRFMALTLAASVAVPAVVNAAEPSAWIGSWTASPQPIWGPDFAFPTNIPATLQDQTIRQVARISLGGKRIRIVLSNEYGNLPLDRRSSAERIDRLLSAANPLPSCCRALR